MMPRDRVRSIDIRRFCVILMHTCRLLVAVCSFGRRLETLIFAIVARTALQMAVKLSHV